MTIADGGAVAFAQDLTIADGSGLISGHTARVQVYSSTGENQILGTADADANLSITRYSNDNGPPNLVFGKSRNGSLGQQTIVADGDPLGRIIFCGSDDTDMRSAGAWIEAECDGAFEDNNIAGRIIFATTPDNPGSQDPTERVRIDSSGYLRMAGAGIQFNGDTAAANALDDYEEGTFTPVLGAHTSNGTHSYTTQVGNYTKVGNVVHIWMKMTINTLNTSGTISGNLEVLGMPYTAANTTGQAYVGTFLPVGLDMDSGTGPVSMVSPNQSRLSLIAAVDDASYDTFTSADVASGDGFWIQISYPV